MVKSKSKILMVIILTILMVTCIATSSLADNTAIIIGGAENNTETEGNVLNIAGNNTEDTNTTTNETANTQTILTSNTSVSQYNTTNTTNTTATLPQTGESDIYVVTALIAICGVSAVYAYKKIREYNV